MVCSKMERLTRLPLISSAFALLVILLRSEPVQACAVCFKDPDSDLTKGAQAGVLFLAIVVYSLMMGIGVVIYKWYKRAKALEA